MLDEQQAPSGGSDPFSQARQSFQQTQQNQQTVGGSFDFQQAQLPQLPVGQNQQNLGKSLFQTNQPQLVDFGSSKMPQALQKLGLDSSGIMFNQLGRIQLMGRLQKRFGANLQASPEAVDLLKKFDEHMRNQGDSSSVDVASANGKRTLAAIFGG